MKVRAQRRRALPLVAAATLCASFSSAVSNWTDFLPKPFENGLAVELFGSHEREHDHGAGSTFGWTDTFFREEVTLFSNGYFYHPRFLRYRLWLSGALKQENYIPVDGAQTGWMTGTGVEYDARLFFLPEHSYNFELFAIRHEPLYMEQSAVLHNSVEKGYGAQFRFRRKPFFVHAGYLDNTTESSTQSANVKRVAVDGQYVKNYANGNQLSLNAVFNDAQFAGSGGFEGTSRDYGGGGFVDVSLARLNASVTQSTSEESGIFAAPAQNDRFAFNEVLSLDLPANFRLDLSYRIFDNESRTPILGGSEISVREERTETEQVELNHTLFQSLDSRYVFLHSNRDSFVGDSTLTSQSLEFDYRKNIRRGRVQTGVTVSRTDSENRGRTEVVAEPHPGTTIPGTFLLAQPFAQAGSVDVFLPSPIPPFPTVHLIENTHFTVASVASRLEVTIFALPPVFTVPGAYDVTVSYALATGAFELLTNAYGFNVSVPLFDNMITPYADYVAVRSDVVSGTFPGTFPDSTTYTLGLGFLRGPWRALAEYQSLDWAISPYRAYKGEVQYIGTVTPSTTVYATGTYLDRYYPETSSSATDPYRDTIATVSGNFQQELLSRTLTLAAGASYSHMSGRVHGDTYSANTSVTWTIGKLDLIAGASAFGSDTQALTYTQYDRAHGFYYFRLRRWFLK
jgi:hypothetical protein